MVKNLPSNAGDCKRPGFNPWVGRSPGGGLGNPLQCSLAWRIPWTEETGGLQSTWLHRIRHAWSALAHTHSRIWLETRTPLFWLTVQWRVFLPLLSYIGQCFRAHPWKLLRAAMIPEAKVSLNKRNVYLFLYKFYSQMVPPDLQNFNTFLFPLSPWLDLQCFSTYNIQVEDITFLSPFFFDLELESGKKKVVVSS